MDEYSHDPEMTALHTRSRNRGMVSIGLKKSLSRDKAACEYYNSEADLADGDLPSLGRDSPTSIPYTKPSAIQSSESRVVSPSPRNNRSATPVVTNKKKKNKSKNVIQKRRWKKEEVTITAPKLSPEAKRKHKVFWSQMEMDSDDSDLENDDNKIIRSRTEEPVGTKRSVMINESSNTNTTANTQRGRTRGRSIQRRSEHVEGGEGEGEGGTTHGIITVLTEMCSDCGWDDDTDEKNKGRVTPDYVTKTASSNRSASFDYDNDRAMVDDDSVSKDDYDDESSLRSKGTFDTFNTPRPPKNSYHMDAYENTAIEVEYFDADTPEDEVPEPNEGFLQLDTSGDVSSFTSPQDGKAASDIVEPVTAEKGGYMMSKSKSWSVPDKNAYLQAMAKKAKADFRKKKSGKELDTTMEEFSVADSVDDILGDLEHSPTERTENLMKMPQPTQVTTTYPDLPPAPTGSMEFKKSQSFDFASPRSAFTMETAETEPTDFISPAGVSGFPNFSSTKTNNDNSRKHENVEMKTNMEMEPIAMRKARSELPSLGRNGNKSIMSNLKMKSGIHKSRAGPPLAESSPMKSNTNMHRSMDAAYNLESTGSIISIGKKKKSKAGVFMSIDDEDEVDVRHDSFAEAQKRASQLDEAAEQRPEDDIFDFDESMEQGDDIGPLPTIKLSPFEDSCDISILGSMMGTGDNASVISGRSLHTTGTNGTNWSTSTRRRHRGAAKHRKAETPTDSNRPSGWLESIKAAAEKSQRRWDPKIGWVDYVESDDQVSKEEEAQGNNFKIGRLKAPVLKRPDDSKMKRNSSNLDDDQSVSSNVPFPSKWEKDRDDMVSVDGGASAVTEVVSNNLLKRREMEKRKAEQGGAASVVTEVVSNKLRRNKEMERPKSTREGTNPDVAIQFDLGADGIIEEEGEEEESDFDNKSESESVPESKRQAQSRDEVSRGNTSINPKKEGLFEWIDASNDSPDDVTNYEDDEAEKEEQELEQNNISTEVQVQPSRPPVRPNSPLAQMYDKNLSQESDGDDFGANSSSFDFMGADTSKDVANAEETTETLDDGFKVIQNSRGEGFEQKSRRKPSQISRDLEKVGHKMAGLTEKSPLTTSDRSAFGTGSVMSTNTVSSKAKSWMQRVEKDKKNIPRDNKSQDAANSPLFVSAADENSTFDYDKKDQDVEENDTVFDFEKLPRKSKGYNRKDGETAAPPFVKESKTAQESDDVMSEITTPSETSYSYSRPRSRKRSSGPASDASKQFGSFLTRLQSCTSPTFDEDGGSKTGSNSMPQAHLAFLRNSAKDVTKNCNPADLYVCGSPNSTDGFGLPPRTPSASGSGTKGKTSVASSYLQAIKEKTGSPSEWGIGKDPQNIKRTVSTNSASSSKSESWQKFLEKRNKALSSTSARRSNLSSNSQSASDYAASKVNEVMSKISTESDTKLSSSPTEQRAKSAARASLVSPSTSSTRRSLSASRSRNSSVKIGSRDEAARAAEDLAAAKVEAMIAMMSNDTLEGEI